jgi:hypothetical protein
MLYGGIHQRTKNCEADELATAVAHNTLLLANIFFQVISDVSIKTVEAEPRVINLIEGEDWGTPIMVYLRHYSEPDSMIEHTRM